MTLRPFLAKCWVFSRPGAEPRDRVGPAVGVRGLFPWRPGSSPQDVREDTGRDCGAGPQR